MAAAIAFSFVVAAPSSSLARGLSIDDVLDTVALDHVTISPDGEWIAAVVQRPARAGEVYGRAAYEADSSRSDVWLISRRTGERRNLTQGARQAAGFWCATWSPDGRRLAMLSTRPEGTEPRGGDNVRIYVWDRTTAELRRLSDAAVMTQTRYGSPHYTLDVRGPGSGAAASCAGYEKAPFVWLDERRLLAAMLPPGALSGLLEEYGRPALHTAATAAALREGRVPTFSAAGSGTEVVPAGESGRTAIVRTLDVETGAAETLATVPIHPFRGDLTLAVSPDRERLAVLATGRSIEPGAGWRLPHADQNWWVEKRLGFVKIAPGAEVSWVPPEGDARYPLEFLGWSPDSMRVALRARARPEEANARLFIASAAPLSLAPAGPSAMSIGTPWAGSGYGHEPALFWLDGARLAARLQGAGGGRSDWWLVGDPAGPANLTSGLAAPPEALRRGADGALYALAERSLVRLDLARRSFAAVPGIAIPEGASLAWPTDPGPATTRILVAHRPVGGRIVEEVPLAPARRRGRRFTLPASAQLVAAAPSSSLVLSDETDKGGTILRASEPGGAPRELLVINRHLAGVDWGATRLIDYRSADGEPLQAAAILPPGYDPARRYPTLVWVYGGYSVGGLNDYFLQHQMSGFYNLYLYAARGYVVLIPSMPLRREAERTESYRDLPRGVLPAVDRLVELGIADPDRVGVLGQSFGGFSVYGLVSQTSRFRAAVAMAGIADMPALYNQFDPGARGYPGIEHDKSENWAIVRTQWGLDAVPEGDAAAYRRNSAIDYAHRVETPLLIIHGEYDKRGQMSQAEAFFSVLHRRGRPARLLRYWGESHSLAQSPANVRSIFEETIAWFDRYLAPRPAAAPTP